MGLSHGIWEPWDVQIARMRGVNDAPIWERDSQGKLGLLALAMECLADSDARYDGCKQCP